ncbi:MAG TPA: arginine repressor [Gemmatimonadales bacterium]|nr:arginine repressor [Gemmatimonadales bacterium]
MKAKRHAAILRIIRDHHVPNQERLRELLLEEGFDVAQATLSRDMHELGLVKVPDADGKARYAAPQEELLPAPSLTPLVPSLLLRSEGVGPLLVLRTPTGSASALAAALDHEDFSEVIGSIAGDDTVLLICRNETDRKKLARRIAELAR